MTELEVLGAELSPGACVRREDLLSGTVRFVVTFPNGRGASIISGPGSYGVELAVLDAAGDLDYSTPVTGDVLAWLTPETLREALDAIARLP